MAKATKAGVTGVIPVAVGWNEGSDGLEREFLFEDFAAAMNFVKKVAREAEKACHHPDIDIRWNRVILRLISHDEGRITERDFALAGRISAIAAGGNGGGSRTRKV
jgi:4a-hydroxytetrahydrobiopterin dehydratase